jgi:hypothetical protein
MAKCTQGMKDEEGSMSIGVGFVYLAGGIGRAVPKVFFSGSPDHTIIQELRTRGSASG